jgi:hypothetical protein
MSEARRPHVVYICGSGRSGSTLLDRVLGAAPGVFSCGELQRFWALYTDPDHLCGCGVPVRACDFWRAVVEKAFGRVSEEEAAAHQALHRRLARTRGVYRYWLPFKSGALRDDLAEYNDLLSRFYHAVIEVSGEDTLIDSSKAPGYAWLVAGLPDFRVSTIEIVRDSRAVANSWAHRTRAPKNPPMRQSPAYSAAHWTFAHLLSETLRLRSKAHVAVRYEDFITEPAAVLQRINRKLDIPVAAVTKDATIMLRESHMVAGNRSRSITGSVTIHENDGWRGELSLSAAVKVTALTWPFLLRHHYPIRYSRR